MTSPVVHDPRPVPWPWTLLEALLGAGAVTVAIGAFPLGLLGTMLTFGVLLISVAVLDAVLRSRHAGVGLERSMRQLVVGGLTLLLAGLVIAVVPSPPSLLTAVLVALGVAIGLFAVLRWDQRTQVERARAVAGRGGPLGPRD